MAGLGGNKGKEDRIELTQSVPAHHWVKVLSADQTSLGLSTDFTELRLNMEYALMHRRRPTSNECILLICFPK